MKRTINSLKNENAKLKELAILALGTFNALEKGIFEDNVAIYNEVAIEIKNTLLALECMEIIQP